MLCRESLNTPSAGRRALASAALTLAVLWPQVVTAQQLPDFTELVEQVGPAVVNIRTLERVRQASAGSGETDEHRGVLPPLRHPAAGPARPAPRAARRRGAAAARRRLGLHPHRRRLRA